MSNRTPKSNRTISQAIDDAEAAAAAVRLRTLGLSYREIAAEQGVSVATAHARVQRALAAVPVESVSELRRVELDRLDDLHKRLYAVARAEHPMVSHGRVIAGVRDLSPNLAAMAQLLRVSESRRKLLGLDAPTRLSVRVADEVTAEIEHLAEQLGISPIADIE
jgi:hypothetical protein